VAPWQAAATALQGCPVLLHDLLWQCKTADVAHCHVLGKAKWEAGWAVAGTEAQAMGSLPGAGSVVQHAGRVFQISWKVGW
jgi:hypothetical protein